MRYLAAHPAPLAASSRPSPYFVTVNHDLLARRLIGELTMLAPCPPSTRRGARSRRRAACARGRTATTLRPIPPDIAATLPRYSAPEDASRCFFAHHPRSASHAQDPVSIAISGHTHGAILRGTSCAHAEPFTQRDASARHDVYLHHQRHRLLGAADALRDSVGDHADPAGAATLPPSYMLMMPLHALENANVAADDPGNDPRDSAPPSHRTPTSVPRPRWTRVPGRLRGRARRLAIEWVESRIHRRVPPPTCHRRLADFAKPADKPVVDSLCSRPCSLTARWRRKAHREHRRLAPGQGFKSAGSPLARVSQSKEVEASRDLDRDLRVRALWAVAQAGAAREGPIRTDWVLLLRRAWLGRVRIHQLDSRTFASSCRCSGHGTGAPCTRLGTNICGEMRCRGGLRDPAPGASYVNTLFR